MLFITSQKLTFVSARKWVTSKKDHSVSAEGRNLGAAVELMLLQDVNTNWRRWSPFFGWRCGWSSTSQSKQCSRALQVRNSDDNWFFNDNIKVTVGRFLIEAAGWALLGAVEREQRYEYQEC